MCFSLKPPQTCDNFLPDHQYRRRRATKKMEFLEVNLFENKKSLDYIGFTDVFEFSSDLKKTSDFKITVVLLMF